MEVIMKTIKLMCLLIAIFGLASTGTVFADSGKYYYGGGKNYYGGGKHFKHFKHHKHHKHHYRGGRHFGRSYYGGRGYYDRGFYRGYGGYGFRIGFGGYFPRYYAHSPIVVVQQAPPVYVQRW